MKAFTTLRNRLASTTTLYKGLTTYLDINLLSRYTQLLVWCFGIKHPKAYFTFADRIVKLYRSNGPTYTVLFLKEVVRLIQKYVAGEKEKLALDVRVGIVRGLPKIIPRDLRLLIRKLDPVAIRVTLSLASVYRVIKSPPKLKIDTITRPHEGLYKTLPAVEISLVLRQLTFRLEDPRFLMLYSAGPNNNPSALGLPLDAKAFSLNYDVYHSFERLAKAINGSFLLDLLNKEIAAVTSFDLDPKKLERLSLGKLSFKEEAAGKVRVFAIVDGWTQSLLSGLHDSISNVLRNISQDGTFDQRKPLAALMLKKPTSVYSFDLSAATDRLPIDLQVAILSILIGYEGACAWRDLLVGREYRAISKEYNLNTRLKYSVGQPMGALSSFAMLGLTHHVIVQIAARRAGIRGWFEDYALLGDDIVIANKAVADIYLVLMKDLGLEINLHKSLISHKGVCEFAKRLISPEAEFTPIGPKNVLMALSNYQFIPNLFVDLHNKGYELNSAAVEQLFSVLPLTFVKGRERLRKVLLWTVQGPFGFISTGTRLSASFEAKNTFNPIWMGNLLARIRLAMYKIHNKEWQSAIRQMMILVNKITQLDKLPVPGFSQSHSYWGKFLFWKLLYGTDKSILYWSSVPSYTLILEKYQNSYNKLWKAKPFLNPFTLNKVDMTIVLRGQDAISPEFDVKSPVELALGDITMSDPVTINKFKGLRPADVFFKYFFDEDHFDPTNIMARPI